MKVTQEQFERLMKFKKEWHHNDGKAIVEIGYDQYLELFREIVNFNINYEKKITSNKLLIELLNRMISEIDYLLRCESPDRYGYTDDLKELVDKLEDSIINVKL
jgi:hypothetical protein